MAFLLFGIPSMAGGKKCGSLSEKYDKKGECDKQQACPKIQENAQAHGTQSYNDRAAQGRKKAAELREKADKTSGEESAIYRELSQNFTKGVEECDKMTKTKNNGDWEGCKRSQEAFSKLGAANGKLWERLKAMKGEKAGFHSTTDAGGKATDSAKSSNSSTDSSGSAVISSEADIDQWLNAEESSKK